MYNSMNNSLNNNNSSNNEEDDDDDDEEDEFYLQKFKSEMNQNYLIDIHPECMKHRDEEISILSKVDYQKGCYYVHF